MDYNYMKLLRQCYLLIQIKEKQFNIGFKNLNNNFHLIINKISYKQQSNNLKN